MEATQRYAKEDWLHTLVRNNDKAQVEALLRDGQWDQRVDHPVDGLTALHLAAKLGYADIVEALIKIGRADIHTRSQEGDTPLHLAALHGQEAVVEKLLQQGATSDLMAEDRHGNTPIHEAAQSGNYKIMRKMLSLAPNRQDCIAAGNAEMRTPLHYAAGSGNPKVVALLLDTREGQLLKDAPDEYGMAPFHFAARSGDVESLQKLAPNDINVATEDGSTALHYAAWNAKHEIVKWLLDKGATLVRTRGRGETPLHLAAIRGNVQVTELMVQKIPECWQMHNNERALAVGLADQYKHDDVVRAILFSLQKVRSYTVKASDIVTATHKPTGATLLHYAAGYGTREDLEFLLPALDKGKSVDDLRDDMGRAPLHWAAMKGNKSTLRALASSGADLRVSSSRVLPGNILVKETPLFLALSFRHLDFAEELLRCDKERSKSPSELLTTVQWMEGVDQWMMAYYQDEVDKAACFELENGFKEHTRKLKSAIWLPSGNGSVFHVYQEIPPVYLALHAKRLDMAKFFQRLSNDEDAVNKKGLYTRRTPLHWAVLLRKRSIVEQLCSKFKETVRDCEEDIDGIAPVQYATEMNMQDIEAELFKRNSVKSYIDGLYRDRQIYVDSTNAILVGAALIASVTFAGWLQPPLGYTDFPYVDIKRRGVRVFWVFNSLSFFAAIATVQAGACGVLPLRHVHIGRAVIYIRHALLVASLLMALSVICVLAAFTAAGFVVLPQKFKYELYMVGTVALGGLINAVLILWFMQRILLAPQRFKVWRRHLLGSSMLGIEASPPSDLTPEESTITPPQTSVPASKDEHRPSSWWDDGYEAFNTSKQPHQY